MLQRDSWPGRWPGWGWRGRRTNVTKSERLPLVIALAMLGLIISQPLGPIIQERITTIR